MTNDEKGTEEPKHPGGRPTEYDPEFCVVAHELAQEGATDFEIAQALEIHVATLYRWRAKHPEFREALRLGKESADERVERSLYHRAVGYSYASVKIMQNAGEPVIVPYTEHVPPETGAATLWLTNRKGENWRSKQALEHTGKDGGPVEMIQKVERVIRRANAPDRDG